jgi:hypothetical protein
VDFAELAPSAAQSQDLPTSGILNVFYDTSGPDWSLSRDGQQHWRLLYETGAVELAAAPSEAAPSVPLQATTWHTDDEQPKHRLAGEPNWIQVDQRPWLHFASGQYRNDDVVLDALARAGLGRDALMTSDHQALLRAARALDAAAIPPAIFKPGVEQWRLLLQIDSDEALGFCWGDVGALYVLIPKKSLAARAFSDAWICMQCY